MTPPDSSDAGRTQDQSDLKVTGWDPSDTGIRVIVGAALEPGCAPPLVNEVWVGVSRLDEPVNVMEKLLENLTPDERLRAERYKVAKARHQFASCRGLLRRILGECLGVAPVNVPIAYSGAGKPVLADTSCEIHFNVTHTDGLALIALARRPIGIDVERTREVANIEGLVGRFFSAAEREAYQGLPAELRTAAFFRGWTCKEAVLKSRGLSVTVLDEFDVELDPSRPAGLLGARHPEILAARWHLRTLDIAEGFSSSLAICFDRPAEHRQETK